MAEVCDGVNEGSTLAQALRKYPKVFPKLYINMIASGEATGALGSVVTRLAELLDSQAELKRKVMGALVYPIMMLGICFLVVIFLLSYVVPEITAIFKDQKATLPPLTIFVIAVSDFMRAYWFLIIGGVIFFVLALVRYIATVAGRKQFDALQLKMPLFGALTMKACSARFARNLGTLLESGVELLGALAIVKSIIGNVVLEKVVDDAINGVREGKSLAAELGKAKKFPKLLVHMIAVGERSSELDRLLIRAAMSYESEVSALVSGLTSLLAPIMIIFLASIVGVIVASIMLPMVEMSSLSLR
jgi:general secretion pathway protein F